MDLEPYPIERGDPLWESGSPQWLERYEYIEGRAEQYFAAFRDSPEYDFTRMDHQVRLQQGLTQKSYERFAEGSIMLLAVQVQAKMLRDAFKRKVATPLTPEERAEKNKTPEYVPQWRKDWDAKKQEQRERERQEALAKQPSKDQYGFIVRRGYQGETVTGTPMPGVACYSINLDEGWTEEGERVTKGEAYIRVLWDCHEFYYPDKPGRPDSLLPGYEKPAAPPVKQNRSMDDLRAERLKQKHDESLAKLDKSLNRGRRK